MSTPIERQLDELATPGPASAPPAAFLSAVRRKRRTIVLQRALTGCGAASVVGLALVLTWQATRSPGTAPHAPDSIAHGAEIAPADAARYDLAVLMSLPEPGGAPTTVDSPRVGDRLNLQAWDRLAAL